MAPKFVYDRANFFRKKIIYFSSLKDTIKNINNKLTMEQKIMFEQTCFGNFLNMGGNRLIFSAQMVHQLLLRQVENPNTNEMWFSVGEKTIRFSMQEFCVVTGLDCSPYPSVDVLTKVEGVRLRDEVFFGNMDLHINDLEEAFVKANIDDDKTIVKLALLYFLETVLLATGKNSPLDSQHLLLVDDLEKFNKYPWGRACFEMTMNSLKDALREKKPTVYNLVGFPFAFQVWAFEAMPSIGTLGPKFATKDGCALPRINSWWSTGAPDHKKLQEFFESKDRLINESYHEVVTVANKGKSPVEAALDPSEPSWPSSQFYGHNSNFHADLKTEIPSPTSIDQQFSMYPFLFLTRAQFNLDKSPNELLDSSSQIILGTSQDINQAKHLLRHCLSTDFESLVDSSQRDKVNSSLELLMKVGNFPPSMLNMVRTFRMNFLGNTDVYSKCKEHVERADKSNKEVMVLREELANNRCQYFQIMGDIRLATNEMKELTNEMEELTKKMEELTKMFAEKEKYKMDLEVKAKDLVEFTKTSKNTFDQSLVKLKNWEMEKESAEEHMADIESQWDEFKSKLAKFL
ncbi:hypothetical protein LWI29_034332 [Acer saccharum]|uniref:DUF1985 domain-containing protein n=1 Tax=Acer saccharum TaxID=4024 RepID=A0AA39SIS8_ACESA|nr:hypothetical protein LWI29_034332 [Acer saccharum]